MVAWLYILTVALNALMLVWSFERREYKRTLFHIAVICILIAAYGR